MKFRILGFSWLLLAVWRLAGQDVIPEAIPEANPARLTASTPATLTPVGHLQFETGSLGALTSPEFGTRIGINQVTKLAVAQRIELFIMTEPYVHSSNSGGGDKQIHPGEVWLGTQAVLLPLPTAAPPLPSRSAMFGVSTKVPRLSWIWVPTGRAARYY